MNWNQVRGGDEVLKVMPCELEDLMMSSTAELSSCCVLVATCPELVFSCSIVVRRVLEAVLDHNNFLAVPSITKGVVLVKLPNKSDAACLHHHVYEWKDHSVRFSKVDKMVMVHVDISHEVHGLVSYAGFIP